MPVDDDPNVNIEKNTWYELKIKLIGDDAEIYFKEKGGADFRLFAGE